MTRKKIYSSTESVKTATLNKNNWVKTHFLKRMCIYRHKGRKHVQLVVDMEKNLGFFKDMRTGNVISPYKKIKWI